MAPGVWNNMHFTYDDLSIFGYVSAVACALAFGYIYWRIINHKLK